MVKREHRVRSEVAGGNRRPGGLLGFCLAGALPALCLAAGASPSLLPALTPAPATVPAAQGAASQPAAKRADLDALLQFSLQDGLVVCTSSHPETDGSVALDVPGHASVQLTVSSVGPAGRKQMSVRLVVRDVVEGGEASTSLHCSPAMFGLSRDISRLPRQMTIQYVQSPIGDEEGNAVRLYIQGFSGESAREKAVFPARDFPSFIRTHLDATDNYLRPMFEAVGDASALFEVPPALGAEALADRLAPDEAMARKVMALVAKLDADAPRERQAAQAELQSLGRMATAVLRKLDRQKLTLEQATRIETLLAAGNSAGGTASAKLRGNVHFLLDCLTCSDAGVRAAAQAELEARTGRPVAIKADASETQRKQGVRELRRQLTELTPATQPHSAAD